MRTTLTLDEDVAARVDQTRRKSGRSFKDTVNDLLRAGLSARPSRGTKPFKVRPVALGTRRGRSLDSISGLLDELDGPRR